MTYQAVMREEHTQDIVGKVHELFAFQASWVARIDDWGDVSFFLMQKCGETDPLFSFLEQEVQRYICGAVFVKHVR